MPNKKQKLPEPSEAFKLSVRQASTNAIQCELCGRTYFNPSTGFDWEEGELEELIAQSEEEPDKYLSLNCDPEWGYIDGKQAVIDCKCNLLSKYENLFWESRRIIAEYFRQRAKQELGKAQESISLSARVSDSVKSSK